jgi:hypothetical protein
MSVGVALPYVALGDVVTRFFGSGKPPQTRTV